MDHNHAEVDFVAVEMFPTYMVKGNGIRLIEQQGRHGLVKKGSQQAVAVPKESAGMVAWVLKREAFSRDELDRAFEDADKAALDRFVQDIERMALIAETEPLVSAETAPNISASHSFRTPPSKKLDSAISGELQNARTSEATTETTTSRWGLQNVQARATIIKSLVIDTLQQRLADFHEGRRGAIKSIEGRKNNLSGHLRSASAFISDTKKLPCNTTKDVKDEWTEPVFPIAGGEQLNRSLKEVHQMRQAYGRLPREQPLASLDNMLHKSSIASLLLGAFTLLLYLIIGYANNAVYAFIVAFGVAIFVVLLSLKSIRDHSGEIDKRYNQMNSLATEADRLLTSLSDSLRAEVQSAESQLVEKLDTKFEKIRAEVRTALADEAEAIRTLWGQADPNIAAFNEPHWNDWTPAQVPSPFVRLGTLRSPDADLIREFGQDLPRLPPLPFVSNFAPGRGLALIGTDESQQRMVAALQSALLRLIAGIPPGQLRFTFVDPIGLGENVAPLLRLGDTVEELIGGRVWVEPSHIEQRLAELTDHMQTVIQKYLRSDFSSIEEYNASVGRMVEAYRVVVVIDFGVGFTETSARRLVSIAQNGPRCGVYPIVLVNTGKPLPYGFDLEELTRHMNRIRRDPIGRWFVDEDGLREWTLKLDKAPPEFALEKIVAAVSARARDGMHVTVPYAEMLERSGLAGSPWNSDVTTAKGLAVPLGPSGARKYQELELGAGTAHHVLLVGQTGSGKSNLLHVMITTLCLKYSPDELELYLVDFKQGVEFKHYADAALPHARVIAIESEREFGLSVLRGLLNEMNERGNLFRKAGVPNIADWRARTDSIMPRILLLVDEFRVFFAADDSISSEATMIIDRLVSQGRAFGIHVVLASQTLAGGASVPRSISDQMAVRIVLMSTEADSRLALADDNGEARLLSRPGEAIYNNARGLIEGNHRFQVADMGDDDARDQLLREELGVRVERWRGKKRELTIFEGHQPAKLAHSHPLLEALEQGSWQPPGKFTDIWMGEPIALRPPAYVRLMRQSGSNVLIVHRDEDQTLGLTAAAILALAAQLSPAHAVFNVIDASRPDGQLAGETASLINDDATLLQHLIRVLPHRSQVATPKAALSLLTRLDDLLSSRLADDVTNDPVVFLILFGIQRIRDLREDESFGFGDTEGGPSANRLLQRLLREGPEVGIHTIAVADTYSGASRVIDRRLMGEFGRRVVGPMLESDSIALLDEPTAARLDKPHRLVRFDEDRPGDLELFRPYSIDGDRLGWIFEAAGKLAKRASDNERTVG